MSLLRVTTQVIALCGFLYSGLTIAEDVITDPVPDDFAFGVEVISNDSHAFQTVNLPDHYYQSVGRKDGKDLRVFNAEGVPLAFTIGNQEKEQKMMQLKRLPIFPIQGGRSEDLEGLALRIERNASGTIIDIKADGKRKQEKKVIAYIIDNGVSHNKNVKGRIYQLEFDWITPEYGFVNGVRLQQSSDLRNWYNLVSNESLSKLSYEGEVIGKQTIDINSEVDKYMRISWKGGQPFVLKSITAYYQWSKSKRELRWQTIDNLSYIKDAKEDDFEYGALGFQVKGHAPVKQFAFEFGNTNAFYRGKLYSRANNESGWIGRGRFLQYKLEMPGGVVESPAFHLPNVRDGEWLLKLDTPDNLQASQLPVVRMAWYPEQLTFLAQGKSPYMIAYGNPRVVPVNTSLKPLLSSLNNEQREEIAESFATLAEPKSLGGLSRLQPEPKSFPWRTVLLWLVLVIGVLIMAKMVISLIKQMENPK